MRDVIGLKLATLGEYEENFVTIRRFKKEDAEEVSHLVQRNMLEVNSKDYDLEATTKLAGQYNAEKILQIASYAHMYVFEWKEQIVGVGAISSFWGSETESIINGSELLDKTESYEEWLQSVKNNENPETVNPDWVVTDTFFAVDDEDAIVGIIDLRHTLNDFLKDFGNSGYSVRPSQRQKGYATEMLRQVLDIARRAGLTEFDPIKKAVINPEDLSV